MGQKETRVVIVTSELITFQTTLETFVAIVALVTFETCGTFVNSWNSWNSRNCWIFAFESTPTARLLCFNLATLSSAVLRGGVSWKENPPRVKNSQEE
jgi:hypothetical protein